MFITSTYTYYKGSAQHASRALFLILMQPERATIGETCNPDNLYACVRRVALAQCGHFMLGRANIGGQWRTISGAYGNDGLPMHLPADGLPRDAVRVPRELYDAWTKGGGHNGAGAEANMMREWALSTFKVK